MAGRIRCCFIVLLILMLSVPCLATGWDDAWAMSNALAVKTCFEPLYYPHAKALLDAEKALASGAKALDIIQNLKTLPGIKGAVVLFTGQQEDAQWPDSLVQIDFLSGEVFNTFSSRSEPKAPMTHRTLGGKVKRERVPLGDNYQYLDLLVRYVRKETTPPLPTTAICLVMDPQWLIAQIPSAMDSLYRENAQLLYCAASPTNKLWDQSLGVTVGEDTLWWAGRKDIKVPNVQDVWPFMNIEIHSYVHTLEKK